MAWLKLTMQDGRTTIFNSDEVSEICDLRDSNGAAVWSHGTVTEVHESVEDIGEMIQRAEWRERVLRVACAIMSNEHTNGLTSEQVWARAVRFAAMDPEQPTTP